MKFNYKSKWVFILIVATICNSFVQLFLCPNFKGDTFGVDKYQDMQICLDKDYSTFINIDEIEMSRVAYYYLTNKGFVTDVSFGRPQFRKEKLFLTAFRPKFNILLHIIGLKLYGFKSIQSATLIPQNYFYYYSLSLIFLKIIFFSFSVYYFFKTTAIIFSDRIANFVTIFYILYPSVFIFLNVFSKLENISLSLIIISIYPLILLQIEKRVPIFQITLSSVLILLACLLRPHILMIYILIFMYLLVNYFIDKNKNLLVYTLISFVIVVLGHLPIYYQHYKDFGQFFLSTQSSLEFFQGHNEYARGSWQPGIWSKYSNELEPMFDSEPNLSIFDEKKEMDFYKSNAINWIINNPYKEFILIIRKSAMFFLPYNYLNHRINIILIIVNVGFFFFLFTFIKNFKKFPNEYKKIILLIMIPILASYLLTIIFFVGERWRYYAEPFMLILAFKFYIDVYDQIFFRRNVKFNEKLCNY